MPIAGILENTFYRSFLSLATFMPPHLAHTKVVGAVHDQDFVPCTSPPDDEFIHSRRKLPPYADAEISCILIQAFTLLVSDSYGLH